MKSFIELFAEGETHVYKKRSIIFSPTIHPKGVYFIKSGFIYAYNVNAHNKKRVQSIMKPGDIFPLLASTFNYPRRFYFEALTDTEVSVLDKDIFFNTIYSNKELNQAFIAALSNYLSNYIDRVENLEMETLRKRVIGRILYFAMRFGHKKGSTFVIDVPLTHQFIAESINVSRSNVTRELIKLEKEGAINFEGKHLVVLDKKYLEGKI